MSDSLRPHESQHARPPCPSPTPGVYSNSCPSSRWCHPAILSSVTSFSSCPQSLPASGSFPMSQLFAWGGQSIGVSASASVFPKNTQNWSPLGSTPSPTPKFYGSLKNKACISNTVRDSVLNRFPLCNPMDLSPPSSSDRGILQARILESVAMPSSRVSSWPRDGSASLSPALTGGFFTTSATWGSRSRKDLIPKEMPLFDLFAGVPWKTTGKALHLTAHKLAQS